MLCCPLLLAPQKLSEHHLLTAGTLAEPESSLPSRERCSSTHAAARPRVAIPLTQTHMKWKGPVAWFSEDSWVSSPALSHRLTISRHPTAQTSHPPPHPALGSHHPLALGTKGNSS